MKQPNLGRGGDNEENSARKEFSEVHLISACYRPGCRAARLCRSHRITSNKVTGFAVTRFNLLGTPGGPRKGAEKKGGNICKIAFLLLISGSVGRPEVSASDGGDTRA